MKGVLLKDKALWSTTLKAKQIFISQIRTTHRGEGKKKKRTVGV